MKKFVIFQCLLCWFTAAGGEIQVPELRIGKIEPGNLENTFGNGGRSINNLEIQLNQKFTKFEIICTDTQPIQWLYKGEGAPTGINVTAQLNLTAKSGPLFQLNLTFFRVSRMLTGNYTCEPIGERTQASNSSAWVYIYADNANQETKHTLMLHGRRLNIAVPPNEDFVLLPCSVSDPQAEVILKKKLNLEKGYKKLERNQNLTFTPSRGFKLHKTHQDFEFGFYVCSVESSDDLVTIFISEQTYKVHPETKTLQTFKNSSNNLSVSCNATTRVTITISGTDASNNRIRRFESYSTNSSSPFDHVALLEFENVTESDFGFIKCVEVGSDSMASCSPKTLHTWSYGVTPSEFQDTIGWRRTQTSVDGKIRSYRECRARSSRSPWIRFVPCKNDMECGMRRRCIETGTCNDPVFGDPAARMCSGACEDQSEVAGFYYCEDDSLDVLLGPGAKISWNFFGVSHLQNSSKPSYSRAELLETRNKAEVLAIIEPEIVNSTLTLYQGEVHNFTCVGSSFVFAGGFEWKMIDKDEMSYALNNAQRWITGIAELLGTEEVFMDEGFIRMESAIKIRSSNIKSIKCVAHLWNQNIFGIEAVDSMSSSLNVTVSSAKSPELLVETFKKSYVFDLSDKNWTKKTIRCPVTGKPYPSITWLKDGKSTLPRGVSSEFNKLTFTSVDKNIAGTYTCVASNFRDTIKANFTVQVFEDSTERLPIFIKYLGCILHCACMLSCAIVMTILVLLLFAFWLKIRQQRMLLRNLTEEEIKEFEHGNPDSFDPKAEITDQAHLLAYNGNYEFPKDQLNFSVRDKLGAGEFGLVLKGYAANIFPTEQQTLVAVKTIKASADITQFKSLLTELKIMSRIGRHPNLVNLLGACTKEISKREVYIILEYCANGDLRSYLRDQHRIITQILGAIDGSAKPHTPGVPEFVNWSYQIASGMQYLAIQNVIHGDLAARNVLLTETFQAKIGDFGMSRRLYAQNYVKKQKMALPWKWMALESLRDMEFSTKSDVWAYGVTLWEIFSLGAMPFPGVAWTTEFMHEIANGHRLERPHYATGSIYNIMMSCWERNHDNRPTFDTLMQKFSTLMKQYAILQIETPKVPPRTPHPNRELYTNFEPATSNVPTAK